MQQRPLGRSGLAVSRLALGTMTWGRDTDADDAAAQLKSYLDAGGNLVDTADVYGDGDAESVIGSLLGSLVPRDERADRHQGGAAAGQRPPPRRLPRAPAAHAGRVAAPARHRPRRPVAGARVRPGHPAGGDPGRAGPRGGQRPGPLRRGVELLRLADRPGRAWQAAWPGRAPVVAAQVEYSLLERGIEREVLPACGGARARRAALVAAGPGRADRQVPQRPAGRLAGRVAALRARSSRTYLEPRCSSIVEAVATAAGGLGVSPLEVALAWVRDRPGVAAPILGARTVGQLLGALQVERDRRCRRRSPRRSTTSPRSPVGYPERDG